MRAPLIAVLVAVIAVAAPACGSSDTSLSNGDQDTIGGGGDGLSTSSDGATASGDAGDMPPVGGDAAGVDQDAAGAGDDAQETVTGPGEDVGTPPPPEDGGTTDPVDPGPDAATGVEDATSADTSTVVDDVSSDAQVLNCAEGQITNCEGGCTLAAWLADNWCDTVFDCEALGFDGGDCVPVCGDGTCNGEETYATCPEDCMAPVAGDNHPCELSDDPGSNDAEVTACACAQDAWCCTNTWDAFCVQLAGETCGASCDCSDVACETDDACGDCFGNACVGQWTCVEGSCAQGEPVVCEETETDGCLSSQCDLATGTCAASADDALCDDNSACTTESCDPDSGDCTIPIFEANGTACDLDEDICTFDQCDGAGACISSGETEDCAADNANNPCWTYTCAKKAGCVATVFVEGASCEDNNPCTYSDTCRVAGGQELCAGEPLPIDDANPCTDDACVEGVVTHTPIDGIVCDVGDACFSAGLCANGVCESSPSVDCDDGDPCTVDACAPETGECTTAPSDDGTLCDDEDPCTLNDVCAGGVCGGEIQATCCGDGICDQSELCACLADCAGEPCDDEDAETLDDLCQPTGECQGTAPSCTDALQNGEETGVDCGGGECPPCPAGEPCTEDDDCATGLCQDDLCAEAAGCLPVTVEALGTLGALTLTGLVTVDTTAGQIVSDDVVIVDAGDPGVDFVASQPTGGLWSQPGLRVFQVTELYVALG
ncbi:MAG: hypothetical protein QF464_09025, partial [Myxococcota bacterium]|nr:hypothetical protein [Myxococcota bacterium]